MDKTSPNKLTIYVPDDLAVKMRILPRGQVSRICQDALRKAVKQAELERDQAILDAFAED